MSNLVMQLVVGYTGWDPLNSGNETAAKIALDDIKDAWNYTGPDDEKNWKEMGRGFGVLFSQMVKFQVPNERDSGKELV